MTRPIALVVFDLDGVLTDGTIRLTADGDETRSIHMRDLDAVTRLRQLGVAVAIVSGEDTASSRRVAARFGVTDATWGAKDKYAALGVLAERYGCSLAELCYVGDADRDVPALAAAGIALAPADAAPAARAAADHVLDAVGGRGAVAEVVAYLEAQPGLITETPAP